MRIGDLVLGDEPGAHARESVGALVTPGITHPRIDILDLRGVVALGMDGSVLKRVLTPHGGRGDVVMNRVTQHVVECVGGPYGLRGFANDDGELRFRVGAAVLRLTFDRASVTDERTRRLGEHG